MKTQAPRGLLWMTPRSRRQDCSRDADLSSSGCRHYQDRRDVFLAAKCAHESRPSWSCPATAGRGRSDEPALNSIDESPCLKKGGGRTPESRPPEEPVPATSASGSDLTANASLRSASPASLPQPPWASGRTPRRTPAQSGTQHLAKQ